MNELIPTQPYDGDLVAYCPHDEPTHMFWIGGRPATVECDDPECSKSAPWLAVCDGCFRAMTTTGGVEIKGHAHWLGDEPIQWNSAAPGSGEVTG